VEEMRGRLGESTQAARRNKLAGMLRGGARQAVPGGAKSGDDSTSATTRFIASFSSMSQHEQEGAWSEMTKRSTLKQRIGLLDFLWGIFPEERQPQLLRGLIRSVKRAQQQQLIEEVIVELQLEERQAIVEKLLRQLQPFEMEMFVDFLPWIWDDDKLTHTAKLYASLTEPERVRVCRMVELGTIEPAKSGPSPAAASTDVAAAAAPAPAPAPAAAPATAPSLPTFDATTQTEPEQGGLSTTAPANNPAEASLEETPVGKIEPWKGLSPSEGDDAPYTLEVFLQTSADCFEAALKSMLGTAKRANWAKSIFNMLLKRAGDAKKTGKKSKKKEGGGSKDGGGGKEGGGDKEGGGAKGAPNKSSMQVAREALFALLRAAQVLAPEHPRAMLFARLCGVYGARFSDARTERVLRFLANLFPENARRVRDEMAKEAATVPLHGISRVLRTMQEEIGAEDAVAIMAVIDAEAQPDPEPGATPDDRAVSLDEALLATMERHDAQRAVSQQNLRGVFERFDLDGGGTLDMAEFIGLMQACDKSLGDDQVSSMFLDCAKASKKIDDSLDGDEVNADAFVEVCDVYGLDMQVQLPSTVW